MFILATRLPSQWLGQNIVTSAEAFQEGNPVDRTVSLVLIVFALAILTSRSFEWGNFLARNWALTALLFYALLSVCWSDFAFVAFKRWFRDLGNYLVILVILSDPRPVEAVRTVLRRVCFLFIPLSILLIKYFPEMAKHYNNWTGTAEFVGAATSKNTLGVGCMISGLLFFWDTISHWSERKKKRTEKTILINVALFAMTFWVLNLSNSATSRVCLILGCTVIAIAHSRWSQRHPAFLRTLVPATFCLYLLLSLGFNMTGQFAGAVGRDPTLTDRTKIWAMLLSMHTNPVVGTGYESFWLGPRLDWIWSQGGLGKINEAHNGYLEVYLNIGLIGLSLLVLFLIVSYRTICKKLTANVAYGSLGLAVWTTMVFHSITEADFRGGLLWLTFLLGALSVRARGNRRMQSVLAVDNACSNPLPLEATEVRT
jgi:O-antigen ligase